MRENHSNSTLENQEHSTQISECNQQYECYAVVDYMAHGCYPEWLPAGFCPPMGIGKTEIQPSDEASRNSKVCVQDIFQNVF